MSTIGYDSWAVDLADVGAVYPLQGWEFVMTIIGVIFWLGWHVMQFRRESRDFEDVRRDADKAGKARMIDLY